ncbi:MAG TPA: DUF945 family protein [Gammaproteobacteria bacterium]|nr:DUF945 family protein [Gammaproteobacteria bacterium]
MKKLLLLLLLLVSLALLGLPPVFGRLTQSAVEERVASLGPRDPVEVKIDSYARGWFSSRVRLSVAARPASSDLGGALPSAVRAAGIDTARPTPVELRIDHGPVSLRDGLFFGFSRLSARPSAEAGAAASRASAPPAFALDLRTDLDGDLHFAADIRALDDAGAETRLSLSGAHFAGSLEGRRLAATGRADRVEYRGPRGALSLAGVALETDGALLPELGLPERMHLDVARASLDLPAEEHAVDARGVSLRSTLSLDDTAALMDGQLDLTADQIVAEDGTHVTGTRLQTAASRLDLAALAEYSRTASRLAARDADADRAAALEPSLKRLLAAGPTLSVTPLAFDVDGQPFHAALDAAARPKAVARASLDADDSRFWYRVLDGSIEIETAKSLAQSFAAAMIRRRAEEAAASGKSVPFGNADTADVQAGLMLAVLATQGMLEDTGKDYKTTLRLENGAVTINGKRLPLSFAFR